MTGGAGEMREVYPLEGEPYRYRTAQDGGRFTFEPEGEPPGGSTASLSLIIQSREHGEGISRDESGRTHPFAWAWVGPELHLWLNGDLFVFQRAGPSALNAAEGSGRRRGGTGGEANGDVRAPMPGAVLEVLVSEGDRVEQNQTVVVMESMKMELVITAPRVGVVRRVSVQPGQQVERGMRLLELAPEGDPGE